MKKIDKRSFAIFIFFFFFPYFLLAELHKPKRFLEFGLQLDAGVSNNTAKAQDFLKKNAVIDIDEIVDGMGQRGFVCNVHSNDAVFFHCNFGKLRFGFDTTTEAYGIASISKDIFDVIATGNELDKTYKTKITGDFQSFAATSAYISVLLQKGKTIVTVMPSYFVPLVYIPTVKSTVQYCMSSSGIMYAREVKKINMYSAIDMEPFIEDYDKDKTEISEQAFDALYKNGGFDVTMKLETQITRKIDVGASLRFPFIPGRLDYKTSTVMTCDYQADNIADSLLNDKDILTHDTMEFSDCVYKRGERTLNRPFRFDMEAAWHTYGYWFALRPNLGFVVKYPGTSDWEFYVDCGVKFDFCFKNMIGFDLCMQYVDTIFRNSFGLDLNARAFEFIFRASIEGENFAHTFKGTGLGTLIGLRFGI